MRYLIELIERTLPQNTTDHTISHKGPKHIASICFSRYKNPKVPNC